MVDSNNMTTEFYDYEKKRNIKPAQSGCPAIQRPPHNSKSQQKEAQIGIYNQDKL